MTSLATWGTAALRLRAILTAFASIMREVFDSMKFGDRVV